MNPSDHQAHQNLEFLRQATGLSHALPTENRQVIYGLPVPQRPPQMVPIPIQGGPGSNPHEGQQSLPPVNFNNTMYYNLPTNFRGYFGPAGQLFYGPTPIMFGPGGPPGPMGPIVGPMGPIGPQMVNPGQPSPTNSSINSDFSSAESQNSSPGSNLHKWNLNAKSFVPGQPWSGPNFDQTLRDPKEQDLAQQSEFINRGNGNMENYSRRKLEDAF